MFQQFSKHIVAVKFEFVCASSGCDGKETFQLKARDEVIIFALDLIENSGATFSITNSRRLWLTNGKLIRTGKRKIVAGNFNFVIEILMEFFSTLACSSKPVRIRLESLQLLFSPPPKAYKNLAKHFI